MLITTSEIAETLISQVYYMTDDCVQQLEKMYKTGRISAMELAESVTAYITVEYYTINYIKEKFSPRLDLTNHLLREDERHA